jgi:hypothetical protein
MFICPKKLLMALLFMLLASSMAFQAVRSVLGGWIATQEGLPKIGGLFVHAIVFMTLSTMLWRYAPFGSSGFEGDDDEEFSGIGRSVAARGATNGIGRSVAARGATNDNIKNIFKKRGAEGGSGNIKTMFGRR